ncbi:MAG: hypothetical protein IJ343_05445, partial [Clostridia bacterium]|nr:hypothetical protein [Clostridia bacterium]
LFLSHGEPPGVLLCGASILPQVRFGSFSFFLLSYFILQSTAPGESAIPNIFPLPIHKIRATMFKYLISKTMTGTQ